MQVVTSDKKLEEINKDLVIEDASSIEIFKIARKVAQTNATILITGETGTGKEILAKYIHNCSNRPREKFVAINCAAIPDTLLESELFGHERGAFTNAIQTKIGKFEEAHRGTILLDEISEMSLLLQAKLLRIIQEKEFSRLGGNKSIKIDARIIATSNRNLQYEIQKGTFREDLFYRLNVIPIEIPNLSQRSMDIIPLAKYFCEKYSNSQKKLSPNVMNILKNHDWKGNIRELENFIYRAVLLSTNSIIESNDIKFDISKIHTNDNRKTQKTLFEIEKDAILNALKQSNGNKNITSKRLDISIRTLRNKLKLYSQK